MKILSDKTIEQEAQNSFNRLSVYASIDIDFIDGYRIGMVQAESLLLPKMIEFAEWCGYSADLKDNKTWCMRGPEWFGDRTKTTSELLDIWIEQNKNE